MYKRWIETYENKKLNKVILCFFGVVPRSIKYTYKSIEKNIINVLNNKGFQVDIYVFNLDIGNVKIDNTNINNSDIHIIPYTYLETYSQSELDKEIDELCKITDCKMRSDYSKTLIRNAIRQMYSEYRVGLFLEKHINNYDTAIVCGPDYYLLNKININDVDQSIYNNNVYTTKVNDADGYTNGFYIGNLRTIIKILRRYENLQNFLPVNKDYEYLLKKSFENNDITRQITDMLFFKIRANLDIARQGIMLKSEYDLLFNDVKDIVRSNK